MNETVYYKALSPPEVSTGEILGVVSQHASGAAFHWILRADAVRAPHYRLKDMVKLDDKVEAHLDGLRVAGQVGWDICWQALEGGELEGVFAAAALAFGGNDAGRVGEVLASGVAEAEGARGLISALGWLPYERVSQHIRAMFASEAPAWRRVGIAATAAHRQRLDRPLMDAFAHPDPALRARACRAVGELGYVSLHPALRKNLASQDEDCRFWGAWSSALLVGDRDGLAVLRDATVAGGPQAGRALQLAMRRMDPATAKDWRVKLAKDAGTARLAVVGAGAIGDPEAVPWLIAQMAVPELARAAGEAFSMITGADINNEDLDGEAPLGPVAEPAGPPEDEEPKSIEAILAEEAETAPSDDPDADLPWPNPDAVRKWWGERRAGFSTGNRYLVGQPIGPESLQEILRDGYQRQRAAAALELAIRNPGQPLFEVRAPGFRQQKLLGGAGA